MNTITCNDSNMYPFKLRKLGRIKKIFWDYKTERSYYMRGNMRTYLDTVEKMPYPYFYYDVDGKLGHISGWEYIGAYSPIYVEILPDCETVQLWQEV